MLVLISAKYLVLLLVLITTVLIGELGLSVFE